MRLVDATRTIRVPHGRREPRTLVTFVRYPAVGPPSASDEPGLSPDRAGGPYPLIVFGHGFRVTPGIYGRLLRSWAAAGYVVASPVFPLENANAPGGPDETDLVNQPEDIGFVVTRLLAENRSAAGPLRGMIDPRRIAVAGHSDGAETALAVAYARGYRDSRVRAAVILSGAKITGLRLDFAGPSIPLLATQGTADRLNLPSDTRAFFGAVPRPKFLLTLLGAKHLAPYTYEQPQLRIVEQVTRAFLDHVFKKEPVAPLIRAATVPGLAELAADG
jgi:dienelactone hydrolase